MFKTDVCPQGHVWYLTVAASQLQATSDCLGKSRPTGLAQAEVRNQVPLIITISCNSTAVKKLTWINSKKNVRNALSVSLPYTQRVLLICQHEIFLIGTFVLSRSCD